jgi:hypothetical protein
MGTTKMKFLIIFPSTMWETQIHGAVLKAQFSKRKPNFSRNFFAFKLVPDLEKRKLIKELDLDSMLLIMVYCVHKLEVEAQHSAKLL